MKEKNHRIEEDSLGKMEVDADAYYGVNALRARENFSITGLCPDRNFTRSLVEVKKACALTNHEVGLLSKKKTQAIVKACDRILDGEFLDQFITDAIQGGAGTSFNMNANEVIANIAIEELGGKKGDYSILHPNDHVNMGQSTNDVIPTAGKMTMIRYFEDLGEEVEALVDSLDQKAHEFDKYVKIGRTQLEDAVPIRLGQEFSAYASVMRRDVKRIQQGIVKLSSVNLGGTATGTGLNADQRYVKMVVPCLSRVSGLDLVQAEDLIDGTQNLDAFLYASSILKILATSLSKISNDFRLMGSGPITGLGEIQLPPRQAGSSIMPGKVNPVIPEVVNQVCFNVVGNDMTVTMAVEAGQLELNAFEPVIFHNLFENFRSLIGGVHTLRINCVDGISSDKKRLDKIVEASIASVTAIAPHIGYVKASQIAKKALQSHKTVRDLVLEDKLMDPDVLDAILDPYRMTMPGVIEEDRIKKEEDLD